MREARTIAEIIGDAAADCEQVTIAGDVYALGQAILAALSSAGIKNVPGDVLKDLCEALREVLRITDRKHVAWDRVRDALAKVEGL